MNYYFVILGYGLVNIMSVSDYDDKLIIFSGTNVKNETFTDVIINPLDVISVICEEIPIDNLYLSMYLSQYLTGEDMDLARDMAFNL